jgi:hypothetical protein
MEDFSGLPDEEHVTIERRLQRNYGVCSRIPYEQCHREVQRKVAPEGRLWCDNVIDWIAFKGWIYFIFVDYKGGPYYSPCFRTSQTKTGV